MEGATYVSWLIATQLGATSNKTLAVGEGGVRGRRSVGDDLDTVVWPDAVARINGPQLVNCVRPRTSVVSRCRLTLIPQALEAPSKRVVALSIPRRCRLRGEKRAQGLRRVGERRKGRRLVGLGDGGRRKPAVCGVLDL
jgi:hypothetical protein